MFLVAAGWHWLLVSQCEYDTTTALAGEPPVAAGVIAIWPYVNHVGLCVGNDREISYLRPP